jgi:hypothetical protein
MQIRLGSETPGYSARLFRPRIDSEVINEHFKGRCAAQDLAGQ